MLIPPQLIKQEVNREVARETNAMRANLIRVFNQMHREAMKAKAQYEQAPSPAGRDKIIGAIGQLQGYLQIRDALRQVYADNTLNQTRGLIRKLTELVTPSSPTEDGEK